MKAFTIFVALLVVIVGGVNLLRGGDEAAPAAEVEGERALADVAASVGSNLKEFALTAMYEVKDGKPMASFSQKSLSVMQGDRVRIAVTNAAGVHDFTIDEYNVNVETPENEVTVVEFTADKAGEFSYYCSKFNHAALGQTGTLKVLPAVEQE